MEFFRLIDRTVSEQIIQNKISPNFYFQVEQILKERPKA